MNPEDEDAALYAKVASGDESAFARLFDRHQERVVRFTYRFVGNRAQAEELAQDIFVKLFRNAKSYRPTAQFKTFLFRIATNHCLNEMRRPSRRTERSTDELPDHPEDAETPEKTLEARHLEKTIQGALKAMSERERAAFCMCRFEGLSYRDIASALDASEGAVKSLIHRATLQVTEQLSKFQMHSSKAEVTS